MARKYDLVVIEDAAESLGAKHLPLDHTRERGNDQQQAGDGNRGLAVGSLGDIACLSFNGNKIITTGGGGMIVTDNEVWARRARYLTTQAKDDPMEYIHNEIGYNYRLTNIQAAMGVAQLEQLNDYITAKRRIAFTYSQAFSELPGIVPMQEAEWAFSTFWMYTVLVNPEECSIDSRVLLQKLDKKGIQTRPLWQPIHLSPAYAGCQSYHCDVAEQLNRNALSLPSSVGLTASDQQRVIEAMLNLVDETISE